MGLDLDRLRADTPGSSHRVHLNNAGAALMPQPVLDAMIGYLRREGESAAMRRRPRPRRAWRRSMAAWPD